MAQLKDSILTFGKAQFSAWIATAADFAMTLLLGKAIGLWYPVATCLGAICGGVVNCMINYRWVFDTGDQKKLGIAGRYLLVWGGSILMNTTLTYLLTELSGIDFIVCKAIAAAVVAVCWNYQMQRFFVFHHNRYHNQPTTPQQDSFNTKI